MNLDVRQDDALAVVETNMHLVPSPGEFVAIHMERNTLWLCNINGLELVHLVAAADELWEIVVFFHGNWSSLTIYVTNVDAEHFLRFCVDNDSEIQGVGILVVEISGTVIRQSLLKAAFKTPPFVNTDCPGVDENL